MVTSLYSPRSTRAVQFQPAATAVTDKKSAASPTHKSSLSMVLSMSKWSLLCMKGAGCPAPFDSDCNRYGGAQLFRHAVIVAPPVNYDDAWFLFNAASG